ncbi:MAG: deoxyribose-phosphate aldolase [bacterium]|nr:deoxyribose-phosphate aldolase [bacterium]
MDDVREPLTTYQQIAKMIDHSLVRPELNDEQVIEGCKLAKRYRVATVSVRPSDVDLAVGVLKDSDVKVGSISGFPHGSENTAVKLYETRDLLRRGAKEIDMVLNIGKLLSRQFHYVENELLQMAETCHEQGALLKVIFENAFLTEELKIVACKISKRARVDFSKTATGFAPSGATMEDLRRMVQHCQPRVKVKAAGGIRTLDKAIEVYNIGCTRIGATATATILDAWKQRLATRPPTD